MLPLSPNLSQALSFSDPGHAATSTPFLPDPTPQLPPAFFSSSISQLNSLDSFTNGDHSTTAGALDILDDLYTAGNGCGADASTLDNLDGLDTLDILDDILDWTPNAAAAAKEPKTELGEGRKTLDEADTAASVADIKPQNGHDPKAAANATKQLDSLDALDSFPAVERVGPALPKVSVGGTSLDSLSDFSSNGD